MVVVPEEYFIGRWDQANIPIKFRGMRFSDYEHAHPSGRNALSAAEELVDNFTDHYVSPQRAKEGKFPANRDNIGKGMLLFGRNGTRKSTLAAIVLTEIQYKYPSVNVYYIRFSDWKKALTDTFVPNPTDRSVLAHKILGLVESSALVVFDDIGQEHRTTSGFTESSLHEALRVRYESAKPTIVTTNIDPDFMQGIYGDSFESFRHDAFDTYPILGPDTRKPRK